MIVEMVMLVLIAVAVFVYVLAPIVLPRDDAETATDALPENAEDDASEPAVVEKQPVRDLS